MESILSTIKTLLGIPEEYTIFDTNLIIHINSAFMALNQIGVGPSSGYSTKSKDNVWSEFIDPNSNKFESVKTYIYLKTKIIFDPPASSILMESLQTMLNEYEWRLHVASESINTNGEEVKQNE